MGEEERRLRTRVTSYVGGVHRDDRSAALLRRAAALYGLRAVCLSRSAPWRREIAAELESGGWVMCEIGGPYELWTRKKDGGE